METVVVVFDARHRAIEAIQSLRNTGIDPKHIEVLLPGESTEKEFAEKAHVHDEGKTPGAWGALGGGIGSFAGAAFVSAIIPGIGPVLGLGALAAAFIAGAVGGIKAGDALERHTGTDNPRDDTWLFAEMLRAKKSVVVVKIDPHTDAQGVHAILRAAGGHTVDYAREHWTTEARQRAITPDWENARISSPSHP